MALQSLFWYCLKDFTFALVKTGDEGSSLHEPEYFCPPSLMTKLSVGLREAEETAELVQVWAANMEKNKQRLQDELEDLTVDLEKARNPAIWECQQDKPALQDLRPGTGSPGSLC